MEPEVTPEQAAAGGATLVDVRTDAEWARGRLPGAVHIPLPELQERAAEVPDGPVVFYCRTGDRSTMAAQAFRASGREAATLRGGLEGWEAAGLPTDT